jgi:hypothetical protein
VVASIREDKGGERVTLLEQALEAARGDDQLEWHVGGDLAVARFHHDRARALVEAREVVQTAPGEAQRAASLMTPGPSYVGWRSHLDQHKSARGLFLVRANQTLG